MTNSPPIKPTTDITYSELAFEVRKRDRRFRFAQGLFMAALLVGFSILGFLGYLQIQKLNDQAAIRSRNLEVLIADNQRQTEYIKCIARFFNERNRSNANLKSLDDCVIQRADGSTAPPDNVPPDTQATSSTSIINVEPMQPQPTVTVVPPNQNPTITVPVPENPVTPPSTNPSQDPVRVLGIPICVPLTNVCVRR